MIHESLTVNAYFAVVLVALVADYVVRTSADALNLGALWQGVPGSLQSVYDREQYTASQRYARSATWLEIAQRTVLLTVLLLFWFMGGFGWLDTLIRSSIFSVLGRGLLYLGAVVVGYAALSIPFDAYRVFSLEARFGFNRTSVSTFFADRAKGLLLLLVLGGTLAAIVVSAFVWLGSIAWLVCLIAVAIFVVLTQLLAPAIILPLFNKYTPMPAGEARDAIMNYASSVDFPVKDVYVIDGSRRSSRANAFFTGLGRHRRIALFDTLLEQHTIEGLVAVLAHEIGHYKRGHVVKGVLVTILHAGILLVLLSFFLEQPGLFEAFGVASSSVYVGLVLFTLLYTPVETGLSVVFNVLSRRHEYEADRFAVGTIPSASALADALRKLSTDNLSNPHPHPFLVVLEYSHPPLARRLAAIESGNA